MGDIAPGNSSDKTVSGFLLMIWDFLCAKGSGRDVGEETNHLIRKELFLLLFT